MARKQHRVEGKAWKGISCQGRACSIGRERAWSGREKNRGRNIFMAEQGRAGLERGKGKDKVCVMVRAGQGQR